MAPDDANQTGLKLLVIGGGTMGSAMLAGALEAGVVEASEVAVVEPVEARREQLSRELGVAAMPPGAEGATGADAVLVAVKPQDFKRVDVPVNREALTISIMAGLTIDTVSNQLGVDRVVRVMPNLPAAVQAGMCVWTATDAVDEEQRVFAARLLSAAGAQVYVDDEAKLDIATAVSGSGPGYVYLLMEALVEGGVRLGLARDQATTMAVQTFLGAAVYAAESGLSLAELRGMVTSAGGTTAAGIHALEARSVRAAMAEAVEAAHRRARELGGSA